MKKYCELLAPVGSSAHLRAAVENGADAVYLGGKLFNARINAGNFEDAELEAAIDYAHLRDVKVYVVMNTLIEDSELAQALDYAIFLGKIGADALIIQDLGLARIVRQTFPEIPLHLSTQGSVCNKEGVTAAGKLGFERVVLARELSPKEIKECAAKGEPEIEVFVHGALCLCYSGQCQLSRVRGGRSGNKGMCAQPCRLPFAIGQEKGHLLSPKDLCLIDHLGELIDAGVASLKIEGRMKSPEYVAIVTSIYRKYIDEYFRNKTYTVTKQDKRLLQMIFNRGGFTDGYLFGNPGEQLISRDVPKNQGIYIGRAVSDSRQGLVKIKLAQGEFLSLGDGVELRDGKSSVGNVVTYIKGSNDELTIGDFKGKVLRGAEVYKVTDKQLLQDARQTFAQDRRKSPIEMIFTAKAGELPLLQVSSKSQDVGTVTIKGEQVVEASQHKALTEQAVLTQLEKTGGYPFAVDKVTVFLDQNVYMPVASINRLRRQALEALAKRKTEASKRHFDALQQNSVIKERRALTASGKESASLKIFFQNAGSVDRFCPLPFFQYYDVTCLVPLAEYLIGRDKGKGGMMKDGMKIVPYIHGISNGEEDRFIRDNFTYSIEGCRDCGIYIGNIGWIAPFAETGIHVHGGFALNMINQAADEAIRSLGAQDVDISLEVCDKLEGSGAVPLMITEHPLLNDWRRKGDSRKTLTDSRTDKQYAVTEMGDKTIVTFAGQVDFADIEKRLSQGGQINIFI